MKRIQFLSQRGLRLVRILIVDVVIPFARLIHEGVASTAEDDAFWFGVCGFLFFKSLLWLLTYHTR